MADYLVTGKKGNGKSLVVVGRIRDALREGRPIATNLDLNLEHLLPHSMRKVRAFRVPDQPTRADLDALGEGNDTLRTTHYDEGRNGVIVLDELATWLNARTFADKTRQGVLDWLVHSRKLGWDTYLIAQNPNQIDKQVREALAEYVVTCYRLDKFKIPVIGYFIDAFVSERLARLPRFHIAITKMSLGTQNWTVVERDFYRGDDLHAAYDTRQIFSPDANASTFTVLAPGYFSGYGKKVRWWTRFLQRKPLTRKPVPKPRLAVIELLTILPPDQRVLEIKRLQRLGAL